MADQTKLALSKAVRLSVYLHLHRLFEIEEGSLASKDQKIESVYIGTVQLLQAYPVIFDFATCMCGLGENVTNITLTNQQYLSILNPWMCKTAEKCCVYIP